MSERCLETYSLELSLRRRLFNYQGAPYPYATVFEQSPLGDPSRSLVAELLDGSTRSRGRERPAVLAEHDDARERQQSLIAHSSEQ